MVAAPTAADGSPALLEFSKIHPTARAESSFWIDMKQKLLVKI